jgi:hypothetical protein
MLRGYLHFDGSQAGARTLVDIVVTRDLAVTTSEQEQTPAQKRGAVASGLTPERKAAVQPDGQVASQQAQSVTLEKGFARRSRA